ncbi:MAG: aconitase X swivel domain-containing protein [Chloroflexota bacterium]
MVDLPVTAIILHGHAGAGPDVEAEALVCDDNFSARYDVNRRSGVFSREMHALFGVSLVGKVCVFNTAKGGVATAWALLDMQRRGVAPAALVFRTTNPIMVQGAVLAAIPIMDRLDPDPLATLRTGDLVRVRPAAGVIEVVRRAGT